MTNPDEQGHQARQAREEAEWREIVANFGERAELAEPEPPATPYRPEPVGDVYEGPAELAPSDDEDRFVPPPPPPVPRARGLRLVAWIGLFGVPTLALIGVVLGISLPSFVGLLLIAWFVGGFGYLVATMSDGKGPDSGWDDGAVL